MHVHVDDVVAINISASRTKGTHRIRLLCFGACLQRAPKALCFLSLVVVGGGGGWGVSRNPHNNNSCSAILERRW